MIFTSTSTTRIRFLSVIPCFFLLAILIGHQSLVADSLKPLHNGRAPKSVDELWEGYDPRAEPLNVEVDREWTEDGVDYRYVLYSIGTFKGKPARMAAFYGFPTGAQRKLPAVLHMHGGGQRAYLGVVKQYAQRGYAVLSVNWGGREMEGANPGDPNTDWGAIDPTQNNVSGYNSLMPRENTIDEVESPRNNNWFLLTIGCRRGITFLEEQAEVNAERIGILGHSMGGRLTCLVAGTDKRVKAASPSVGGSGFLQTDLWGLPGSARRVSGDLKLFQKTLAGQAYLSRIECPILFLSATNDFNAPLDFVERGMALVPHDQKRTVYAVHLNHRFTPEADVSRQLWFDAHLNSRLELPQTPETELLLQQEDGIPIYRVKPDASRPIERVDIYYGYERDPRNRFWADANAQQIDNVWVAKCPVFDNLEPLFVLANVSYRLTSGERHEGDPETFILSVTDAAYPNDLKKANVKVTETQNRMIDDFHRGFHDWYTLQLNNQHHWYCATRKLTDPRWSGPDGGRLIFELTTTKPKNMLAVQIDTNAWRGYSGFKRVTYTAIVPLERAGKHSVQLRASDFVAEDGAMLSDWYGITELAFRPADKALPTDKTLGQWQGEVPKFASLRWEGGKLLIRPKPYPEAVVDAPGENGLTDPDFQKAIERSLNQ